MAVNTEIIVRVRMNTVIPEVWASIFREAVLAELNRGSIGVLEGESVEVEAVPIKAEDES